MAKRMEVTGAKPKKLDISDQSKRRVEAAEIVGALGANPACRQKVGKVDLLDVGELGNQLLQRLRSSGGRPALADASEVCRVPLSAGDWAALQDVTNQIVRTTGMKASPGQVASIIVREYLTSENFAIRDKK